MFDLNILEKQLEDALENKSVKKPDFKKNDLSNNKQTPKNKIKEHIGYGQKKVSLILGI